jgi:putative transposase
MDVAHPYIERDRIVDLHAWCLMRNHYHLLVSEHVEGGVTSFMRKLNTGYTNYFNERYKRNGVLFQGRTKKVLIHSSAHFLHVLHYIHLNPLDYLSTARAWRSGRVSEPDKARAYLEKYRWSSYADYCDRKNFPSIVTTDFFKESIGNVEKETLNYLGKSDNKLEDMPPLRFLE